MKRKAGAVVLLSVLGGCVSSDKISPGPQPHPHGAVSHAREVPGVQGPYGQPVPMYNGSKSGIVQASATAPADGGVQQAGRKAAGCDDCGQTAGKGPLGHGRGDGPRGDGLFGHGGGVIGPGKLAAKSGGGLVAPPPGAVAAVGALPGIPTGGPGMGKHAGRTSVRFTGPAGMKIAWFAPSPESKNGFTPTQVEVPGRYNFVQGGIYRLKLGDVPNRPALELYPTLEIMPSNSRTCTFLAHSAVPVGFTEEDFAQVEAGNFVVKVIYLPNPEFQELAVAGPDEIISTRLEPGVDPIMEATRRGSILAVIRMGNIDLESPNTPSMAAPPMMNPYGGMPFQVPPGGVMPGDMPMPGTLPGAPLPPGAVPLPHGAPLPPGAVPQGTPLPPGAIPLPAPGARPVGPNAGRAAVSSPADAPALKLPDPPAPGTPTGKASVSVDGMLGRMK